MTDRLNPPPARLPRASHGPNVPRPAGSAPSRQRLHEAALRHLARFAATQAGLVRVLQRRVDRWAQRAAGEGMDQEEIATVVRQARGEAITVAEDLVGQGVVDDAAFASARARRLSRSGRSARSIGAALAQAGVPAAMTKEAIADDPEAELDRAVLAARRKRIGPFSADDPDADPGDTRTREAHHRASGQLARAGFAQETVRRVLSMSAQEAQDRVLAARQRD